MKLFKIIASQGGRVVFDDRLEAPTPREARNQMRALLGMRSLTGVVYSITEIPVELIGQIAEAKVADALRCFGEGTPPPDIGETIRVAAAEEVRRQLGELRAEAIAAAPRPTEANGHPPRFDPFHDGVPASPGDGEIAGVQVHSHRQINGIRSQTNESATPDQSVVERIQSSAGERRHRQRRGRPPVTTDGRAIDWKAVRNLYRRNRSLKQTAADFDISVNTVKARARKEGWATS